jgi:hypothetical protein
VRYEWVDSRPRRRIDEEEQADIGGGVRILGGCNDGVEVARAFSGVLEVGAVAAGQVEATAAAAAAAAACRDSGGGV